MIVSGAHIITGPKNRTDDGRLEPICEPVDRIDGEKKEEKEKK